MAGRGWRDTCNFGGLLGWGQAFLRISTDKEFHTKKMNTWWSGLWPCCSIAVLVICGCELPFWKRANKALGRVQFLLLLSNEVPEDRTLKCNSWFLGIDFGSMFSWCVSWCVHCISSEFTISSRTAPDGWSHSWSYATGINHLIVCISHTCKHYLLLLWYMFYILHSNIVHSYHLQP